MEVKTSSDPELETKIGTENIFQSKLLTPILLPEIVSELVKFMSIPELGKYRLVCKLWNDEIIRQMKETSIFVFDSSQSIEDFQENGQLFFGFKNLKLICTNLTLGPGYCAVHRLLSLHGKFLKGVEFDYGPPPLPWTRQDFHFTKYHFEELEYLKLTNLSSYTTEQLTAAPVEYPVILHKLTTLHIHLDPDRSVYLPDRTQKFFTQLLNLFPNLKELQLSNSNPTSTWEDDTVDKFKNCCLRALLDVNPPNLKRLICHSKINREWAVNLANNLLNIQKLLLHLDLEGFTLNFESDLSGINIEITPRQQDYSGLSALTMMSFILAKLGDCEEGISCTRLLMIVLTAFEEIIRIQAGINV